MSATIRRDLARLEAAIAARQKLAWDKVLDALSDGELDAFIAVLSLLDGGPPADDCAAEITALWSDPDELLALWESAGDTANGAVTPQEARLIDLAGIFDVGAVDLDGWRDWVTRRAGKGGILWQKMA